MSIRQISIALSSVMIALLFLSCTDSGVQPTEEMIFAVPEEFVQVPSQPIDQEIIYLFEVLDEQGSPTLLLRFHTKQYYPHTGWYIISTMRRTDYRFAISLERIYNQLAGRTIASPAKTVFNLGNLPNGAYSFDIHINSKTVRMAMLVRDGWVVESRIQPNNYISERVWMPD